MSNNDSNNIAGLSNEDLVWEFERCTHNRAACRYPESETYRESAEASRDEILRRMRPVEPGALMPRGR